MKEYIRFCYYLMVFIFSIIMILKFKFDNMFKVLEVFVVSLRVKFLILGVLFKIF